MTRDEILSRLVEWFVETTGEPCDPRAPYAAQGNFDSFDAIQLVDFVERTFAVRLTAADIQSEEFRTLAGLSRLIEAGR